MRSSVLMVHLGFLESLARLLDVSDTLLPDDLDLLLRQASEALPPDEARRAVSDVLAVVELWRESA